MRCFMVVSFSDIHQTFEFAFLISHSTLDLDLRAVYSVR